MRTLLFLTAKVPQEATDWLHKDIWGKDIWGQSKINCNNTVHMDVRWDYGTKAPFLPGRDTAAYYSAG